MYPYVKEIVLAILFSEKWLMANMLQAYYCQSVKLAVC